MSWATFRYANPEIIHWGPGARAALGEELDRAGARSLALVTTRSVAEDGELMAMLSGAWGGREVVATLRIGQHAPVADIDTGVAELADRRPDAIVSTGGGSPIDAAKIMALRMGGEPPPHFAIPTTLSVAELAAGAGMTDAAGDKVGLRDPRGRVRAVIYDAEVAVRTPLELWLSTGIRALDHAVEGFLSEGDHPFADVMCLESVRRLLAGLPAAKAAPGDVAIRGQNQLAAWFGFTLPAAAAGGLSHVMGKQIGARHGIPHGVTSCLLLPHVLRYRATSQPTRMAELAAAMGGEPAAAVAGLVAELGLPGRLAAFGLSDEDLLRAAGAVSAAFDGAHPAADLLDVYRAAL